MAEVTYTTLPRKRRKLKREAKQAGNRSSAPATNGSKRMSSIGILVLVGIALLVVAFEVYGPALHGPLIFDDAGLPFSSPHYAAAPLFSWISGVRPVLMLSYWLNYQVSSTAVYGYHAWNVMFHALNSLLLFFICRQLLARVRVSDWSNRLLAAGAAGVYLLHPLQTEAVAYISGRSEILSATFVLAALLIFIGQPPNSISWRATIAIVGLYACATLTKEQAAILPLVLLLTDVTFNGTGLWESVKARRRLYGVLAVAGVAALAGVWSVLANAKSAGFHLNGISWYEYFFTQARVLFLYIRLFFFPVQQNADYDIPTSHSALEHGAIWGLGALAILAYLAWRARRRYPLAAYGFLVFLVFLAPTSSVIPISDLAAERRMYLPLAGLVLVCLQPLLRVKAGSALAWGIVGILLLLGSAAHERSKLWANAAGFWEDVIAKSPAKERGYTYLMATHVEQHHCKAGVALADKVPATLRDKPEFLIDWGAALECNHQPEQAVAKYRRAAETAPNAGNYLVLACAYLRMGRSSDAAAAFDEAQRRGIATAYEHDLADYYEQQTRARTPNRISP